MFAAVKEKGQWVVFDTTAHVFYYPEKSKGGRRWAEKKAKELNNDI